MLRKYTVAGVTSISVTTCGDGNEITRFILHTIDGDVHIDAVSCTAEEKDNVIKFERATK